MSTFRKYESLTPTIDFFTTVRKNTGLPKNGEDIRVAVLDASNNTEILFQAMPEIGNTGYYKYTWNPVFTENKRLFVSIFLRNNRDDKRKIIDTMDICINNRYFEEDEKIDENDGQIA